MIGVVTDKFPYMIVLELCRNGELKDYLESSDTDQCTAKLLGFMLGIARGMEHLAENRFIHR